MPARALHRPQSLTSLPIRVDGKLVTQPVFFPGQARRDSADPEVKIGLLSMDPVTLPEDATLRTRLAATLSDLGRRDRAGKGKCGPFLVGIRGIVSSRVAGDGQREAARSRYRKRRFQRMGRAGPSAGWNDACDSSGSDTTSSQGSYR